MSNPNNPTLADRILALLRERPRHWRDLATELGMSDSPARTTLVRMRRAGLAGPDPNCTGVWHIAAAEGERPNDDLTAPTLALNAVEGLVLDVEAALAGRTESDFDRLEGLLEELWDAVVTLRAAVKTLEKEQAS